METTEEAILELTNQSNYFYEFDDELIKYRTPFIALQLTIGPITIIGSLVILALFYQTKHPTKTASRKYFIALATIDLQTGIIATSTLLHAAAGLKISDPSCVICTAMIYYIAFATLFLLVGMTTDRYFAILYPLKYKVWATSKLTYLIILLCYVGGIVIGFGCYFAKKDTSKNPNILCFVTGEVLSDSFSIITICGIVIPCEIIFLYAYGKIFKIIMNSVRIDLIFGMHDMVHLRLFSDEDRVLECR